MLKHNTLKKILSVVFIIFVLCIALLSGVNGVFSGIAAFLKGQEGASMAQVETNLADSLFERTSFINLNGFMAKLLSMQGYYSNMGIYVTSDNYIVNAYTKTSTDFEIEHMVSLKEYLDGQGINLLYVNEPLKYTDDAAFTKEFGVATYGNANADLFLSRLDDAGINYVDLRENMAEEGKTCQEMFYRTDHHWTTESGLWAASKMAQGLNDYCGYNIDLSIYDEDNFEAKSWKNCWLGEQGRLVAKTYVGLDDYTELKPKFATSYTFKNDDGSTTEGTFEDFIDESVYNTDNDVYENSSWHYSYSERNCINNNEDYGKVLLIGDSYDLVTEPFLSLGVKETDYLVLRGDFANNFDLKSYITENGYDTVIIAYVSFVIGGHDDTTNINYSMFDF